MTKRFAISVGAPWLYSKLLPRWFVLRVIPSIRNNRVIKPVLPTQSNRKIRGNNISVKLDELDRFRVSFYLNDDTLKKIRSTSKVQSFKDLKKINHDLLMSYGKSWLLRLFKRLRLPSIVSKRVSNWLLNLIMKYMNKSAERLWGKVKQFGFQSKGCTIEFVINLPKGFTKNIKKMSLVKIPSLIKSLASSRVQILGHVGYRM
jgi:hypothetical protein